MQVTLSSDPMQGEAEAKSDSADSFPLIRRLLFWLFLCSVVGTGTELVLLDHYDVEPFETGEWGEMEWWKWAPLLVLTCGLVTALVAAFRPGRGTMYLFRGVLLLVIAAGFIGLYKHYVGNEEWELELAPTLEGLELFGKTITGAFPTLAPAAMMQLGVMGLAYTYRHPCLKRQPKS
jgi:hypothetical protein